MKIRTHPGLCDGHGLCHRFVPEVYSLDEEGYIDLHVVEVPPELQRAAMLGASICPVGAITVIHEPGDVAGPETVEVTVTRPTVTPSG